MKLTQEAVGVINDAEVRKNGRANGKTAAAEVIE
jgi:hypothetical protein